MKQFFFVFAFLIWASYALGTQSIGLAQEADGCRHLPSSVLFPLHDELTQRPMTPDDYVESRGDVSVEYSHSTIPLLITLYVYSALHSLDHEFTYAINEIYSALGPQLQQTKPRVNMESSLEILGYSQEFRYTGDLRSEKQKFRYTGEDRLETQEFRYTQYFRSEKQVLVTTVEVYQTNGWFVKARMTVPHDYAPNGRRLVIELLDTMDWPQPIRTLPITFFSPHILTYLGKQYKDDWFGNYLPLVQMLQEEPRLSVETVEALVQYESQVLRAKRSALLWAPIFLFVIPIAPLVYIDAVEPGDHPLRDLPVREYSTGSKIALGFFCTSWLIGLGLLMYAVILAADESPFPELGLANRDLMGSR